MESQLRITFRDFPRTEAIESYVRTRVEKLETLSPRITGCHVTIGTPHRHQAHGRHHHVKISIGLPGRELVIDKDHDDEKDRRDLHACIDAAFDDARRVLRDYVRGMRAGRHDDD